MWLFVLSVLAIGRVHVQSVAIGYPYHTQWSYNPNVQDQFPLKSGSIHGYLRYLDNNGAGGVVNYNDAQPVYAVSQVKYVGGNAPQGKSNDVAKIRETCIRAVSLQQYQNLKRDIDAIRSEGKEPVAEKILRLQTFEKIAFTSDFSLIADLPEVKLALKDLNENIEQLFEESVKQARNQQSNNARNQGEVKIYSINPNEPLVGVEETPEQRQAREEHLRIYNEQIAHLKQLELEHEKYVQEASLKSKNPQSQNIDSAKALAELERAQQEHFRLWNEAKLRAEQAEEGNKELKKENIISNTPQQPLESDIFQNLKQTEVNEQPQAPRQVKFTPEVIRAREEHLRLVHEANSKAIEQQEQKGQKIYSFSEEEKSKLTLDPNIKHAVANQNGNYAQNFNNYMFDNTFSGQQRVNTVPVANQKSSLEHSQISQQPSLNSNYRADQPSPVIDTPEVIKARAEHLRLVQEANLQAQFEEQKDSKQIDALQSPNFNSNSETLYIVQDTPEVVKAREEHLRLVQEANLQAQLAEQQELKQKQVSHIPILKSHNDHAPFIQSETAKETSEIVQSREELVHPVSGPNTKINPSQEQQAQIVKETPEVQQAREEHLRIFNAIKSHTEQEQAKQGKRFPDYTPIDEEEEMRLLELERLHEKERLQKEQQQLELDRMIEAERLAEEKHQMEAELLSLRLEEQQRLEIERLLEAKRLQEEQEELQKLKTGEYQEIIIENDSIAQQPLLSGTPFQFVDKPRSQQGVNVAGNYANNPFLNVGQISSEPANRLEHSVGHQSSHLKTIPVHVPTTNIHQHNSAVQQSVNTDAAVRRVPSSHHASGNKHQYIKDDNIKNDKYYHNTASTQPADTAVPFSDLERATREHFRAHEQALEQLRLARLQNPSVKNCN
ncbi:uncharacterized protein ACRADG_010338 [Cochliomyia hominivorax]